MATNFVIIEGNLGKQPDIRFFQSGKKVVQLAVAVSRKYQVQNGEEREETSWVDVKAFGSAAETASSFGKGTRVLVTGELRQETWKDQQTGQNRSKLVIIASTLAAVARPQMQQGGYQQQTQSGGQYQAQYQQQGGYGQPQQTQQQTGGYVPRHPVDNADVPPPKAEPDTPF